jgi:hypothetical protein
VIVTVFKDDDDDDDEDGDEDEVEEVVDRAVSGD